MITPGSLTVKNIMASGVQVKRVVAGTGAGTETVWEAASKPVVAITGTSGNTSRDQFRQACIDFGTTYNTVTELPFDLDTSAATSLRQIFHGCSALTSVPDLDTSAATVLRQMFDSCSALTSVPDLDTSAATDMSYMFLNCQALASVPDLDTSAVTDMAQMFVFCQALTDGNVRLIGKHPSVNTAGMIMFSGLTREPFYNADGTPID